jgi:hypothetical protein
MSTVYYDNSANEAIQQANEQLGRAFFGYADLRQRQKAMEIQQAVEQQRLAQQAARDQETAAMNKARLDAQQQYNTERLKTQQAGEKARSDAAAAKQAESDAKKQEAANTKAKQRDYVQKNRPQDLDYFDAFGHLPGQPHSFQTDPETHALEQQKRVVDNEWAKAAKGLKGVSSELDGSPLPGKEKEHKDLSERIARLEATRSQLDRQLFNRYGKLNGGAELQSPFEDLAGPTPKPQAGTPPIAIEDLNVPLPAGVTPFNGQRAPIVPPNAPVQAPAVVQPPLVAPQGIQLMPQGNGTQPPPRQLHEQVLNRLLSVRPPLSDEEIKRAYIEAMQGMGFRSDVPPVD